MTRTNTLSPLDWHIQYDEGLAIAYRLDAPGWLILYAFARLESGLVDLVAFRCEPYAGPVADLPDVVNRLVEQWQFGLPVTGLTVNQVRISLTEGDTLTQARRQLRKIVTMLPKSGKVRLGRASVDARGPLFYARLAVVYADLIETHGSKPGGARHLLAAALGEAASINTVKDWIKKATAMGYWITGGRGSPGDASELARDTVNNIERNHK